MRVVDGKADFIQPREVSMTGENEGAVTCSCGHKYEFDKEIEVNVAECFGKVVPICPKCEGLAEAC